MRTLLPLALLLVLPACVSAPPRAIAAPPAQHDFESDTTYYVVLLRRGPSLMAADSPALKSLHDAHIANIERMAEAGELVVHGPFREAAVPGALAGLYILRAETREQAHALANTDPMVRNGRLIPEILEWVGPRSLDF
jgi:uncharacterized protein YciI